MGRADHVHYPQKPKTEQLLTTSTLKEQCIQEGSARLLYLTISFETTSVQKAKNEEMVRILGDAHRVVTIDKSQVKA